MGAQQFDIAIAGGGLSGALIALALRARRPDISVALVEGGPAIGVKEALPRAIISARVLMKVSIVTGWLPN